MFNIGLVRFMGVVGLYLDIYLSIHWLHIFPHAGLALDELHPLGCDLNSLINFPLNNNPPSLKEKTHPYY